MASGTCATARIWPFSCKPRRHRGMPSAEVTRASFPRNVAGRFISQANSTTVPGHPTAPGTAGLSVWDRSGANAGKQFKDGIAVTAFTTASQPLTSEDFHAAGYNNSGSPVPAEPQTRISALCWGGHLTDAEHRALRPAACLSGGGGGSVTFTRLEPAFAPLYRSWLIPPASGVTAPAVNGKGCVADVSERPLPERLCHP